jgi:1-phosphofructokinase family hexose kinase
MRLLALTPNPAIDKTVRIGRLTPGAIHRTRSVEAVTGGKGNNVARVAKLLGAEVRVGGVLAGHAGRWMVDAYRAEGFGEGVFAWADEVSPAAETRTCVIMVEEDAGRTTVLNEEGPTVPASVAAALARLVAEHARGTDWVAVSGSLPPGSTPGDWLPVVTAGRRAGARTAADASGAWLRAIASLPPADAPDVLRINSDEAAELLGRPVDTVDRAAGAADELRCRGPRSVIVSLGAEGAVAAGGADDDAAIWRVTVPAVPVVSPIGGGDTMLAGVLWSLTRGLPLPEAVRFGAALATAKCLLAAGSRFRREDLDRLLPLTRADRIS